MAAPHRKYVTWRGALLNPAEEVQIALREGTGVSTFFFYVLTGFVLLQSMFDIANLGTSCGTGQLMAFSFVFGSPAGLLWGVSLAALLMVTGCLFDKTHKPVYAYQQYDPSYLIWLLLFWKKWGLALPIALMLFFLMRFAEVWNYPGLSAFRKGYSTFISRIRFLLGYVSGGKTSFSVLFNSAGSLLIILVLISLLMVVEYRYVEAANFSSEFYYSTGPLPWLFGWVFPVVKVLLFLWFSYGIFILHAAAFRLPPLKSLVATVISVGGATAGFLFISKWLANKALAADVF